MSVAHPSDSQQPVHLVAVVAALVTALLTSMTPAFYTVSWRPWARYILAGCIVVVLIIVVRVAGFWLGVPM